jgi:hypothetical protein
MADQWHDEIQINFLFKLHTQFTSQVNHGADSSAVDEGICESESSPSNRSSPPLSYQQCTHRDTSLPKQYNQTDI